MSLKDELTGRRLVLAVVICVIALIIGALIGVGIYSAAGCKEKSAASTSKSTSPRDEERARLAFHAKILDEMKANNIKDELRYLTKRPHLAGTKLSKDQAEYVADKLRKAGFDKVKIHMYTILLSYPQKPGNVRVLAANGSVIHTFDVIEPAVVSSENVSEVVYPFNAYSPAATVEGELVYANFGRLSDFEALEKAGINVSGKILIMRYGPTSRGSKVNNAQDRGAAGCLLFSDPQQWNPSGKSAQYPNGWELPDTGIQRGTLSRRQGDALSREYPSKEGFYRANITKATPLPTIPSQPIQFAQARSLLTQMNGITGNIDFQGDGGFSYRMNSTLKVRLAVDTKLESRPTYTVSAILYGKTEPDRLVLLGNHRDSWTYGAGDASSGQAAMLEIGRSLGALKKTGWRPRRSIMLCSWDAEEFGIHGSTEWVEDHASMLQERAVAYLNVDIAVEGNYTVRLRGAPELDNAFFEATRKVPAPDDPKETLFNDWVKKNRNPDAPNEPKTIVATSGSDYKPFYHTIGISIVDLRYMHAKLPGTKYAYMYPMYHAMHETFDWMTKWVDPDFRYHLTVGKMWLQLGLLLADSLVIPFNLSRAAAKLDGYAKKFAKDYKSTLDKQSISCDLLVAASANLTKSVNRFEERLKRLDLTNPLEVRMANDRIQNYHRHFIHQSGTMGRDDLRNVVYGTGDNVLKSGNKFAYLGHAIYRAHQKLDSDWDEVNKQLMLVVYHLQSAAASFDELKA